MASKNKYDVNVTFYKYKYAQRFALHRLGAFFNCLSCFRHVVLGVYHAGLFGALGLSRRQDLMYKPLEYKVS